MLRKLTVENFFSIKERQTLDLTIARNATDPDGRFATPIEGSIERVPKVVALFGANASGKTNVLRAISFLKNFTQHSIDNSLDLPIPFLPFDFNNDENKEKLTKFIAVFDAQALSGEMVRSLYAYELEINWHKNKVVKESLKHSTLGKFRRLFERTEGRLIFGKEFPLSARDPVREKVRHDASVISTLAKFNHPEATMLFNSLNGTMTDVSTFGKTEPQEKLATRYYVENRGVFDRLNMEIKRFDLGIQNVVLNSNVDGMKPFFQHKGLRGLMSYDLESDGTKTFYNLFPYVSFVLSVGGMVVLDELDSDIHPLLLPELIRMFQDQETNRLDAQLVFSCHNATLFEYLEKEEIYFTEKKADGGTEIYGLKDIKGVRRDTNIYAKYLMGAFGAIPRIG